jgi:hypothetical protein
MKVGDLVILIKMDPGTDKIFDFKLYVGAPGTITAPLSEYSRPGDPCWYVDFPCVPDAHAYAIESYLRLVPPSEKCEEDFNWRDLSKPLETA